MFDNLKYLLLKIIVFLIFAAMIFFLYRSALKKNEILVPQLNKQGLPGVSRESQEKNVGNFYPSQVVDLSRWKLTLPVASLENSSSPLNILQPSLATFEMSPWFEISPDKKGVVFRAPVNAPTTNNSNYPRTELREMSDGGTKEAFWPTISGTHTLFLDEAITAIPKNKPDVVAGQIHGDDDDLVVVRLEGKKLFLARSKQELVVLDEDYVLGRRFTIKFVTENGKISTYYNNGRDPVYVLSKNVNEAYFKAGVYTQSNCETEGSSNLCNADNYGEVVIYQLAVGHQ